MGDHEMATVKHYDSDGNRVASPDYKGGTTRLSWRAGGRGGASGSASFPTKGGGPGKPDGWYAYNAALIAQGHPASPAGWVKSGRRWLLDDAASAADRLTGYGRTFIDTRFPGEARYLLDSRRAFDRHIVPVLGEKWLDEITAADVEVWQRGLSKTHSAKTIKGLRSILGQVMRGAVRDGLAAHDPVAAVEAPKGGRRFHSAPVEVDDLGVILRAARQIDDEITARTGNADPGFGDLVELAVLTGARYGELAGADVDSYVPGKGDRPAVLHITQAARRAVVDGAFAGREIAKPKSAAGEREVELSAAAVRLVERRIEMARDGFLFPAVNGGPARDTTTRKRWLRMLEIARDNGASIKRTRTAVDGTTVRQSLTFHGLRRTHISYRLDAGQDAATVAKTVGHAHASTTQNIYTESVKNSAQRREQMDVIGAMVETAQRPALRVAR